MSAEPTAWDEARAVAYAAGRAARPAPAEVPLDDADGLTLAGPLTARTDLPPFRSSIVDGYAVRGPGPWPVQGKVLAGAEPPPLPDGAAVEIATGAMVPEGTEQIVPAEEARREADGRVSARWRGTRQWRAPGDEAARGDRLVAADATVTPSVIGLAAVSGHDALTVTPRPRAAVVVFGDELRVAGLPGRGRVRDGVGPQLPAWLRRLGATTTVRLGPVEDTLDAQTAAVGAALDRATVVCTVGGTARGPVDHLRAALAGLGGRYVLDRVAVRPGLSMALAELPGPRFVVGMPGNPLSAVSTLVTLVMPLLDGLAGRPLPALPAVRPGAGARGRPGVTHLVPARLADGAAVPVRWAASSMLRGLAGADGFAAVPPEPAATVPWVALPS